MKALTKSRFKLAYRCPAKLYYNERPEEYFNSTHEDAFLAALAQGGFQVGALAKLYYPEGVDLEGTHGDAAIARTKELLAQENVTLFEAALSHGPYLVRVDILVKRGSRVELIEVKAKSWEEGEEFFSKVRPYPIRSEWESYLVDVAFQTWVAKRAYPEWEVAPNLMLVNKSATASVDGLHQLFKLKADLRTIESPSDARERLGAPILKTIRVDREVDTLTLKKNYPNGESLAGYAEYLSRHFQAGTRGAMTHSKECKGCEFRHASDGLRSGFEECWYQNGPARGAERSRAWVFDVWNLQTAKLLHAGKYFLDQLSSDDVTGKNSERQWLQIKKTLAGDRAPFIDREGLAARFREFAYPLHCIDFETAAPAIPFHRGLSPYQTLVFQFSHHVLHADGRVEHATEYLDTRPGVFPNFDFVRALRAALSRDEGTIFRYADHENSVLRWVRTQLESAPNVKDRAELISFIDRITRVKKGKDYVEGVRNMVDLKEMVTSHFYHLGMGGSNSIKKVVPAVLECAPFLASRYPQWIERNTRGGFEDPYKKLGPIFTDLDLTRFDADDVELQLGDLEVVAEGGAAMTAWCRMQFTEMTEAERRATEKALLRYCELDTLSMVWILEYFRKECGA